MSSNDNLENATAVLVYMWRQIDPADRANPKYDAINHQIDAIYKALTALEALRINTTLITDAVTWQLYEDKRLYGNCWWRFVDGKQVRVDPATVMVVPKRDAPNRDWEYKYIVPGQNWEIFGN